MLCDKCKKNQATVHYTQIVNGHKTKQHLCQDCAAGIENNFNIENKFNFDSLFNHSFFGDDIFKNVFNLGGVSEIGTHSNTSSRSGRVCDGCGLTLEELNRTGKLGCAKCCETFKDVIDPALKSIHSGTLHKGKRPGKAVNLVKAPDKKTELENNLKEAIKNEDYEKAAQIRDLLKEMNKEA